jgi:hypothetical protein
VVVGVLHVPLVVGVEGLVGDAGGEGPGAEGSLALWCCGLLAGSVGFARGWVHSR